jgi:type I site-specific restriction-modification system R (restriction) subunit
MQAIVTDFLKHMSKIKYTKLEGIDKMRCEIRRKYLIPMPEETIRQLIIHYLIDDCGIPKSRISVEKEIKVANTKKRYDIIVYSTEHQPIMLVECKAPYVKITQEVFDQAARYNMTLNVPYLMISNGPETYCCQIDQANKRYIFLDAIPSL